MKRYYCTYFDRNYLYKAMALIESLNNHGGDFQLFAVCLDEITRVILDKLSLPNVTTVPIHKIEERDFPLTEAKKDRTLSECYFTMGPTIILRILEQHPEIDVLTYMDADLFFFSSLDPIFNELGSNSVLIHEHRYSPSEAHKAPVYGKYNVGMMCFRNDQRGLQVLNWWRERCLEWCYYRVEDGKFADQAYLNDWPTRFQGVVVLQHIGAGVAPWNHDQYAYTLDASNNVLVNGQPLIFFHFTAMNLAYPSLILPVKFTNYPPLTLEEVRWIVAPYISALYQGITAISSVLPDFAFGLKDEIQLNTAHVFIAHESIAPRLGEMGVSQIRTNLGGGWDCYIPS